MAGLNKTMHIGYLGRDPEIRYTQGGTAVVNFSIATSEQWTGGDGERQERTEWHRIVAFGKIAEILEKYLSKGSQVYIEGKLQTRQWEKDGQNHYTTEIVVSGFQFLGGKGGDQGGKSGSQNHGGGGHGGGHRGQPHGTSQGGHDAIPDDDIPF